MRRNFILLRAIRDLRYGKQHTAVSVSESAGISGFPKRRAVWRLWAQSCFYTPRLSARYLKTDSMPHWQNVMRGHSAANLVPVIASNRVGEETEKDTSITFYGSSFITDHHGCIVEKMNREDEGFVLHTFDLDILARERREWGVFRDRRPEMYRTILTHGK